MQGASRSALAESREVLSRALEQGTDRSQLGEELLRVAGVIGGNAVLRRSLADPSREAQPKVDLINRLFAGRVSDEALHVASTVASRRWAAEGDLTATLESFGVESILAHAEAAGRLSQVEDEHVFELAALLRRWRALLVPDVQRAHPAAPGDPGED